MINNDDTFSLDQASISSQQCILLETDVNNEQQDTREATMWLGTDDGVYVLLILIIDVINSSSSSRILIFQCTETMKTVARKSRIVKQLGSPIHSIL